MAKKLKVPTTYAQQLDILKTREMLIEDEQEAYEFLRQVNYYRLSGYWFHFLEEKTEQNPDDKFKLGTSFSKIVDLYRFDRSLRQVLIEALEQVEITYRAEISYYFSIKYREYGHYDPNSFVDADRHEKLITTLEKEMERNEDSPFVKHHNKVYGGKMPLWCAYEILSFSELSKFYKNLKKEDRESIASDMGHGDYLGNWLHCMSILRNKCAHYSRLYNTEMSLPVKLGNRTMKKYKEIRNNSLFSYAIVLQRLLNSDDAVYEFRDSLLSVFNVYSGKFEPHRIGLPNNWQDCLNDPVLIGRGTKKSCSLPNVPID